MPTKSLPKLKEKLKRLLKKPQKKTENQPPQRKNLSPNLLQPIETDSLLVRALPQIVKTTALTVQIVAGLFALLLLANFILDMSLNKEKGVRDNLIAELEKTASITDRAESVANKIAIYQGSYRDSPVIAGKFNNVLEAIRKNVILENMSYRRQTNAFTVYARAPKATHFAFMIGDVLDIEEVKDISIRTVELKSGNVREFVAILDVNLK